VSSYHRLLIFLILILSSFSFQFSSPASCLEQSSDKAKVDVLYQKFVNLYEQGRYQEAIQYAKELIPAGEKAFGKGHINVAIFMNNLAGLYRSLGDYAKAEPLYKRSLSIREKALGPDHPDVASSLNNLAILYYSLGDYAKAEPLYNRALAIFEKALGHDHPNVAKSLNNLAALYDALGDYNRAEPLYKRSLAINEKVLGPNHPDVAESLNNLAELYRSLGDYAKAEPLYKRSLAIKEKVLAPDHSDVASSLNNLAILYYLLGDFAKAEPLYNRALAICEKALGHDHPNVAKSLNNLAALYDALGDYNRAEPLYKRSLSIIEKALGPNHPDVAESLNNLAALYKALGDYAKAEPLYKRSLAISEQALGPDHPDVASSLNKLAALYRALGDYARAEPLYKRSLAIFEQALGPNHPDVAESLNNLAALYRALGDYARAEPLYKRSLAIREQALGPDHPNVSQSLNNLAELYRSLGDYARAEPLSKRSLSISEKAFGPNHPDVAQSLNNLAALYQSMGDYAKAEPLYKRSLAISEQALGPNHPDVATFMDNLACVYAALDDFHKAHSMANRSQQIANMLIDQVMGFTSEDQKMKFLSMKKWDLYSFLSLVVQHLSSDPLFRIEALDVWLKRKGVILEAQKRFQETLTYSDDPEAVKTFQELAKVRGRLSKLTFSGPGKGGPAVYKKKIKELEKQKDILEAKLSKLSEAFALQKRVSKADSEKIAKALPDDTVLLEFARIGMFNFKAKGKEKKWGPDHYVTFVLHAGKEGKVGLVDLGNAGEIDKAVSRLKEEIRDYRDTEEPKAATSSKRLYKLVFEPLKKEIGDKREIFISPDGNLNLIPFEILQGPDGRFLIEDYTFYYQSAGRDVLAFGEIKEKGGKALIMGDPDFDMATDEKGATLRKLALSRSEEKEQAKRSKDMRGFHFKRLPGTKEEVEIIQGLLGKKKSELYTGKEAIEDVIIEKGTPSILHLATHGFFLSDLDLSDLMDERSKRGIVISHKSKGGTKKVKIENPLLRSGIALAGANNSLKTNDREISDGIVTAEEILGLRLRGTDMVVLSACETGVGEVKTGEGVFGLRRAFTQAGARCLVMSMWSVPDKETKELMVQFYKNILSGKMNRCQALRQAALEEMKIVKERYGLANPFYWGAFVFMGEP